MKPENSLHKRPFTQRKALFQVVFIDVAQIAAMCTLPRLLPQAPEKLAKNV
jgi:hypothetical protein